MTQSKDRFFGNLLAPIQISPETSSFFLKKIGY